MPTGIRAKVIPSRERLRQICAGVFAEKEIFFRSEGRVRFIKIGSRPQLAAASVFAALVSGWVIGTLFVAYQQFAVSQESAAISARAQSIAVAARKVDAFKASVDTITRDLDHRQDLLDDIVQSQFGAAGSDPAVVGAPDDKTAPATGPATDTAPARKVSAVSGPDFERLRAIKTRQNRFATHLASLINQRADKVEAAIRSFGLSPAKLVKSLPVAAQGGPYIPYPRTRANGDVPLSTLANALARLNSLERGLVSIPSGRPTDSAMLTSSYGYRRDPFNGHAAFHAGVDFPGRYNQPILAAAAGRVSYVGGRSGYGNVVEIDHGNGMMTRYAHLSRAVVSPGDKIPRGMTIGRMGSTGRSTGTHLHFEVRVNGAAINPRRFLEVNQDVLQIQQNAKRRVARVGSGSAQDGRRG